MKAIISIAIMIFGSASLVYGVINIISASKMPESAGLGAFAKQGAGLIYIGIGVVLLLIQYFLKKKSIL